MRTNDSEVVTSARGTHADWPAGEGAALHPRRSYGQYCALARALDRIGDRWTLLIVRELLISPRRYSDLRASLDGIASNLLAARLRELEEDGLVRRREVPPPTPATLYELTEVGRALEPALLALTRWGSRWMEGRRADRFDPHWLLLAVRALFDVPLRTPGTLICSLRGGGATMMLTLQQHRVHVAEGPPYDPDVTIDGEPEEILAVLSGRRRLREAADAGRPTVTGSTVRIDWLQSLVDEARREAAAPRA